MFCLIRKKFIKILWQFVSLICVSIRQKKLRELVERHRLAALTHLPVETILDFGGIMRQDWLGLAG